MFTLTISLKKIVSDMYVTFFPQDFIRQQIEEKERQKREEKQRSMREEQEEEERLRKERERIKGRLQEEKDQVKVKEVTNMIRRASPLRLMIM